MTTTAAAPTANVARRVCRHHGCEQPVKKITAKYCSVSCCATDPERLVALRHRSHSRAHQVLPMSRQLAMPFAGGGNPEAALAGLCEGRDDLPAGISRFAV